METGKTTRYLKYAIGEIILVVIGILIALQINNWNQNRLESIEEQKILKNLKIDFENNKRLLDDVTEETERGIASALNMLNHTGKKEPPRTSQAFDSLLNAVFASPAYYPVIGTLDEITNSGKLGILNNTELRKLLATWPAIMEMVEMRFKQTQYNEKLLNEFVLKNGNWLNADQVSSAIETVNFPESGFDSDNRDMLVLPEFENLIENVTMGYHNYSRKLQETTMLLDRIIKLINSEIKRD